MVQFGNRDSMDMKGEYNDMEKQQQLLDKGPAPCARNPNATAATTGRMRPRFMISLLLFVSITFFLYTFELIPSSHHSHCRDHDLLHRHITVSTATSAARNSSSAEALSRVVKDPSPVDSATGLQHIVFGIAASAQLWEQRKEYIKVWWQPGRMRGVVWLDSPVKAGEKEAIPPIRISADTSKFPYNHKGGHRSAIRISRIVSEMVHLDLPGVRWFVMGDDDTVFVPDNLVRVLSKYDHRQYYYIGSNSESHLQNIYFNYGMAYGGGGFAISYPLAVALSKMQDRCIHRYPTLYGSDDRMQACMAELGVPLTKEPGFHQYDVYGNLFGLLAAHPVSPLVSLHHLDVVEPIFPNVSRAEAMRRLFVSEELDSAGLIQQSICYDEGRQWTVSVSWGFAIQILRGVFPARDMEMPARTFLNWYPRADYTAFAFNTRPVARNPCQKPFVFYLSAARFDQAKNQTITEYARHWDPNPVCNWKMADPDQIDRIVVYKKRDPSLWSRSPRRNCCRLLPTDKKGEMLIDVGLCRAGEIIEVSRQF